LDRFGLCTISSTAGFCHTTSTLAAH